MVRGATRTSAKTYTGIDYHKRYSVACTLDARGHPLHEARIDGNATAAFAACFKKLGTPSEVVIEACWNWGPLYDLLEDTAGVAKVHVPSRDVRQRKNVVRQRPWLARLSACYPALAGACALGERILNHLILTLRDDFRSTPEFKKIYRKGSFDDWGIALDVLSNWNVLLPEAAMAFGELKSARNAALHFRPETDANDRGLAMDAIKRLQQIVNCQFSAFKGPWYISKIRGAAYVRRPAEAEPFVKRIILPNCVRAGPKHRLEHATAGWKVIDSDDYDDREITDEEFARLVDPH